jgi:hypothetical protein
MSNDSFEQIRILTHQIQEDNKRKYCYSGYEILLRFSPTNITFFNGRIENFIPVNNYKGAAIIFYTSDIT